MGKLFHLALIVMLLAGGALAQTPAKNQKAAAPADELAAALPKSDLIAVLDVNRLFTELLPKLAELNVGGVDKMARDLATFTQRTGIDPAKIQAAVLGVNMEGLQGNGVLLVKGLDLGGAQIEALMKEWKVEFKTADYKGKTIYSLISKIGAPSAGPFSFKTDDLAMTSLGNQRMAVGDLNALKQVIDIQAGADVPAAGKPMLAALAETRASALVRFALNVPDSLREQAADQGDLFKSIASIKMVLGTLDAASDLSLSLDAVMRTASQSDAGDLESSLKGLLVLVKGIFGGGDPKSDVLGALLDQIRIGSKLSDVSLSISLPRAMMDQLSRKPAPAEKK
jgi:hypothetical protein